MEITSADLNNDSNKDIIVSNYIGSSLSVLFCDGSGGVFNRCDYPVNVHPGDIVIGDFNLKQPPETQIDVATKGGLGIHIVIKNTGNFEAYDVEWFVNITGGLFGGINQSVKNYMDELSAEEEIKVDIPLILGFGPLKINVRVSSLNTSPVELKRDWLIVFFFVFG